ncbi:MAG: hypothetical protein FRX48_01355 [Lasallia pustulata]|uniref:K Homology domain-containing protein n=1 Tax=Lasallia pustulata TaxID=136370 RepID=A0A5M8PZQ6_9LECA|nr:MAG: hypothetical protein FRX48_01355 [Lasallia pustulata]
MAEQPNISQILAALAAQRPGGTPTQSQPPQQQPLPQGYPGAYQLTTPPTGAAAYPLPQPSISGSLDLSNIKPINSGSVSLADAIAKARGIAAEKGVSYDASRRSRTPSRDSDPRLAGRMYRRSRSRSRSPPRIARDSFRDNYNPYRDERRDEPRRANGPGFTRERSFSPSRSRGPSGNFSPPPGRAFGGPGERTPPDRRGAVDDNVETIVIESGLVGLIIGRQGENLRRVEADTNTRVQFMTGPDASGPMRQCKITGPRQAREDAKNEIYRIIDENGNGPRGAAAPDRSVRGSSKGAAGHQPALRVGEDATQIMVPNRTVGLIIGRGGETIRDLQERSQCHVNIVGEEKSVNGLRPVNLIGTPQAAATAKDLIMEIVDSDTKSLANQGGAGRDMGRGPGYGVPGGGDAFNGGDKINDTIIVPSEAVGMIIGKGGETIKDMQSTSGCKINVAPASGQDYEREIGLVGSRVAIEQAKRAIMDKVEAVEQKNRPGGGRRGGDDPYSDRYSQAQQPYGQQAGGVGPQPQATPQPGGEVDPYAAYGGYNNYVAMWYAAMAQPNQQPGQGPPGEQRPPGTA